MWPTRSATADHHAGPAGNQAQGQAPNRRSGCAHETRQKSGSRRPGSSGSSWSIRVKTPSVTTVIRVDALTRESSAPDIPRSGRPFPQAEKPCTGPRSGRPCAEAPASGCLCRRAMPPGAMPKGTRVVLPRRAPLQVYIGSRCPMFQADPGAGPQWAGLLWYD